MTEEPTPIEEPTPVEELTPPEEPSFSVESDEITSDDKLWVLLAYILSPLVPIIILLVEGKKNRPFIRAHNAQALVMGVVEILLSILLSWTVVLACLPLVIWFVMIYWGIQGFQGKYVNIPVVTNFVKNQGWA
jgi:uncharacterized membrane protein